MKELTHEETEYAVSRLVDLMTVVGLNQLQLEQLSGVDQSTISRIVKRQMEPSADVLKKLLHGMGYRLADILHESEAIGQELLGYLATPLTGVVHDPKAEAELVRVVAKIKEIAADQEFSSPPFDIYWPGDHTHPTRNADFSAEQVYLIDRSRASSYDFVILFCASPSYGVGQENEIATQSGIPAIRLLPDDISRMMSGSFIRAVDVKYTGTLVEGVRFSADDMRNALKQIRLIWFRHRAFYKGMNGDGFGARLHKLIRERAGDDRQFAADLGVTISYLRTLVDAPLAVSNPSVRLLKRMAALLGEHVGYLIGESEETDPIWVQSNLAWHSWIIKAPPSVSGPKAVQMRDNWRQQYFEDRRQSSASFRKSHKLMREADWDQLYQQSMRKGDGDVRQQGMFS